MIVDAQITIRGTQTATWAVITDLEHAAEFTRGIEAIEVLEKPAGGPVGLRWKETRILFGEAASVEKTITEVAENEYYRTRAESDGFVFLTTLRISAGPHGVVLTSTHETRPQGVVAKLKSLPMVFFKRAIRKAIQQDLQDIKAAVERMP